MTLRTMQTGLLRRELPLCVLVLALSSYAWLFSAVTVPNERTRLYLTVALWDEGTIAVDGPIERFGRVFDLSHYQGQHFTDKAPGSSFLALPVYAVARVFHTPDELGIAQLVNLVRTWLMLPVALLGFLLLRALLRELGTRPAAIDIASLGFALGSVAFHYGTAFYGHVLVSTLLLLTLWLLARAGLFTARNVPARRHYAYLVAAGASAGLMGFTEYQAIAVAALLALPIVLAPGSRRSAGLLAYALGGAPFACALLVYNSHAFGGPFELSYHHLVGKALQDLHGFGLAGATVPTWPALSGLLFSEHRGLVTTSPLMGLGLVALVTERTRMSRGLWLAMLLCVLYFVLIVASSSVWFGGWSFGPRLLVPITPLLCIAAARLLHARDSILLRGLAAACVGFAIAYHGLVQLTFAELPPSVRRPLADVARPMIEADLVSPNLACKLGALGAHNLWPALLLMAAAALYVAFVTPERTQRLRILRACTSVAGAALALSLLWAQAPSNTPAKRAKWAKMVTGFAAREHSCQVDTDD
jgi:hypothetical protein